MAFEIASETIPMEADCTTPSSRRVAGDRICRGSEFEMVAEGVIGFLMVRLPQSRDQKLEQLRQGRGVASPPPRE